VIVLIHTILRYASSDPLLRWKFLTVVASLAGGLVILLVWALCWFLAKMPPAAKSLTRNVHHGWTLRRGEPQIGALATLAWRHHGGGGHPGIPWVDGANPTAISPPAAQPIPADGYLEHSMARQETCPKLLDLARSVTPLMGEGAVSN
jgi:hypothetical protein